MSKREKALAVGVLLLIWLTRKNANSGNIGRLLRRKVFVTGPTMQMAVPQWVPFDFRPPDDATGALLLDWWPADGVGEIDTLRGRIRDWSYFWANPYPKVNEQRTAPTP